MHSNTLKRIIVLSTIIIAFFIMAQLFWLTKQYAFEQKEFTTNIVKSIRGLYEDFNNNAGLHLQKSIELPNKNVFLFKFDTTIIKEQLEDSLSSELEQSNVFTDCKIGMYDARLNKYLYQTYLPTAASHYPNNEGGNIPIFKKEYNYICLFFPHRNEYVLGEMTWWVVSSVLLVMVLISFGISLFYLYKHKFLNEVQNDFIRNVTHEFQTPLTTLTVGLDALVKPNIAEHPEKMLKYVKLMQGQTTYLKHHIENLMKVMKAEAGGLPLTYEPVVINTLINNAITQLYVSIEEKKAKIELLLEPTNATIKGNTNSLYVVILNLISNAIKYSTNPLILIETNINNNFYCMSIKDNGIGIEKKYIKNLFKKFYRVPTGDTHNIKGLGLGLYFVKKTINDHDGVININSIPLIGTEFYIKLPIY